MHIYGQQDVYLGWKEWMVSHGEGAGPGEGWRGNTYSLLSSPLLSSWHLSAWVSASHHRDLAAEFFPVLGVGKWSTRAVERGDKRTGRARRKPGLAGGGHGALVLGEIGDRCWGAGGLREELVCLCCLYTAGCTELSHSASCLEHKAG